MSSFLRFRVGEHVSVQRETRPGRRNSEGGNAFITSLEPVINVRYVLTNLTSPDVNINRINKTNIATRGRRNELNGAPSLSLIDCRRSDLHHETLIIPSNIEPSPPVNNINDVKYLLRLLLRDKGAAVKEIKRLNQENEKGWLRLNTLQPTVNNETNNYNTPHLSYEDKNNLIKLAVPLKMFHHCTTTLVSYAFGIDPRTVRRLMSKEEIEGDQKRKVRNDKGKTFFNCEEKRNKFITKRTIWRKALTIDNRGKEPLGRCEIASSWTSLSNNQQERLQDTANQHKVRCRDLPYEAGKLLRRTKGRLTWRQITSSLCGDGIQFISHVTLSKAIMSLPKSQYIRTRC